MSGSFKTVRWSARVHSLDLGLYSHPKEILWMYWHWANNANGSLQYRFQVTGVYGPRTSGERSPYLPPCRQTPCRLVNEEAELLLVGCLTSQQQASVSQGRICSDNFTCCHTEIEVADPTFYLTQSQYTDTGPTSPSADPIMPGAWQGSHWSANF